MVRFVSHKSHLIPWGRNTECSECIYSCTLGNIKGKAAFPLLRGLPVRLKMFSCMLPTSLFYGMWYPVTLNNVVRTTHAAQRKCWYEKFTPHCGFVAWWRSEVIEYPAAWKFFLDFNVVFDTTCGFVVQDV